MCRPNTQIEGAANDEAPIGFDQDLILPSEDSQVGDINPHDTSEVPWAQYLDLEDTEYLDVSGYHAGLHVQTHISLGNIQLINRIHAFESARGSNKCTNASHNDGRSTTKYGTGDGKFIFSNQCQRSYEDPRGEFCSAKTKETRAESQGVRTLASPRANPRMPVADDMTTGSKRTGHERKIKFRN